jgi:acyl transferase domain-containing protein
MKKTMFLFSGEGTRSGDTGFRLLTRAPSWTRIEEILKAKLGLDLEEIWHREAGRHRAPFSPLLTVVSQICLAEIWRGWGYRPDVAVGHSTGELAAAYEAGLYSLEEVLRLTFRIGDLASRLDGVMAHGRMADSEIGQSPVAFSSFNFEDSAGKHVTVCGYPDEMEAFLRAHPGFVKMKLPHPWHHPDYARLSDDSIRIPSHRIEDGRFVSGVTTRFETRLSDDHWAKWLVNPVDFIQTLLTVEKRYGDARFEIIEIGFHPVLGKSCEIFKNHTHASSMFRGEDDLKWILHQRRRLDPAVFRENLKRVIDEYRPGIDFGDSLAYQGFDSLQFTELSERLQPWFPSLAPQDFYRFKTIDQLIAGFGAGAPEASTVDRNSRRNGVVIRGMSCRFPDSVETVPRFWEMLVDRKDQVKRQDGRGASEAGFLNDAVSRFDHAYFRISPAEAGAMDPQQILALELTEMLWKDAGINPETLDRTRVGVYIGVWNQEYAGDRTSVYYPTGTNPSMIAARISHHYDLRGPSWVSNTACSSSLVAVHYAAKDIESGRVDYAVAGGVNMLLDEGFTQNMRNSGFLSRNNRCKTFDDSADGYVRAEGGGLVLLVNKALVDAYYAEVTGSSINQNGGRSQVITAPHPEAQEELIRAACRDAGIAPKEIAYIEAHGTGTKIGDPIEMSAIQNTVAEGRTTPCHVGSVKSNIGHLESAAGIAGLIKSVAALNHGFIPPGLHFETPNAHIDFESHPVRVVAEKTPIDHQAHIGVSSFGFGGSNAHVLLRGAEASVRKAIRPVAVPFDRNRAAPFRPYLTLRDAEPAPPEPVPERAVSEKSGPNVRETVETLLLNVTDIKAIDPEVELLDQGLDSMSATELAHHLEEAFHIEIEPDLLFDYPLFDALVAEIEKRIANRESEPAAPEGITREAAKTLSAGLN